MAMALVFGLGTAGSALALYINGKPIPYDLPRDWGRVRFLLPPGAQSCSSALLIAICGWITGNGL
jgi:hypothetical protein